MGACAGTGALCDRSDLGLPSFAQNVAAAAHARRGNETRLANVNVNVRRGNETRLANVNVNVRRGNETRLANVNVNVRRGNETRWRT